MKILYFASEAIFQWNKLPYSSWDPHKNKKQTI